MRPGFEGVEDSLTFWPYNIAKCRISRISTYLHQEVPEQDLQIPCCQMDVSEIRNGKHFQWDASNLQESLHTHQWKL